jgi:hypothetical protein
MYGFGVPKIGFYHIHVPEKGMQKGEEEYNGVMVIKEGVANTGLIKMELKVYDEEWDWHVKQCDRDTFRIVFPSKMFQQYFTRLKSFEFNSSIVKARITASDLSPGASARLKTTWVKVSGIPKEFRDETILKHVCSMIGKPEQVDKEALKEKEYDRVKIKCRKSEAINIPLNISLEMWGTLWLLMGVDRAKNDDNPSDHDPSSFDQSKDDQDRDKDRDRERKGDTEDSDSSGEFKMTTEQKAMWKELKYQISGKGGNNQGSSQHKGVPAWKEGGQELGDGMAEFHPDVASSTMIGDGVGDQSFALEIDQISEDQRAVGAGRKKRGGDRSWGEDEWRRLQNTRWESKDYEGGWENFGEQKSGFVDLSVRFSWISPTTQDDPMGKFDLSCELEDEQEMDEYLWRAPGRGEWGWGEPNLEKEENGDEEQEWVQPRRKSATMKWCLKQSQPTRESARLARDGVPVIEKAAKRVEGLNDFSGHTFGILNSIDSIYLQSLALYVVIEIGS